MGKARGLQTILGAGGTIGRPLATELRRYTDKIRLVSRNPKKIHEEDELFAADLTDPAQADAAISGSSVVYLVVGLEYNHEVWASKWPPLMRAVLDACIKHGAKLVFFDNMYVYAKSALGHMTEDTPIDPPSRKGAIRNQILEMLWTEVQAGRLRALVARSADFYGPGNEKSFVIETVFKSLKKGKRAMWFVDGDKKHSLTYTPDAARATALLGNTEDAYNQVWHLPTDPQALTGRQLVSLFAQELNQPNRLFVLPLWMLKLMGVFMPLMREMPEMMYQQDRDYVFDSTKFQKRFGVSPTSYAQGVKETVAADRQT